MKAARTAAVSKQAPAIGAKTRIDTIKDAFHSAKLLLPTDTQSIVTLTEYTWPMRRVIAGYTPGKSKKGASKGEQSIAMRSACMYRDMLRPLVNAARVRSGVPHVERVTKVS